MLSRLATRGEIAFCRIASMLNRMNISSYNILCKTFDAQVQPILLYESELWGLNVIFFSLKKMLQVPIFTPMSWYMEIQAGMNLVGLYMLFPALLNTGLEY